MDGGTSQGSDPMNLCSDCVHRKICKMHQAISDAVRSVNVLDKFPVALSVEECKHHLSDKGMAKPKPEPEAQPLKPPTPERCNFQIKQQGTTIMHTCTLGWKHPGDHYCGECHKTFTEIQEEAKIKLVKYKDKHKPLPPAKRSDRYADPSQLVDIYNLPNEDVERYCDYLKKSDPSWLTKEEAERLIKENEGAR